MGPVIRRSYADFVSYGFRSGVPFLRLMIDVTAIGAGVYIVAVRLFLPQGESDGEMGKPKGVTSIGFDG